MMALERSIIETHDDYSVWRGINAGFDDDRNFVVEMEYVNYDEREPGCRTLAIVEGRDAYRLAHDEEPETRSGQLTKTKRPPAQCRRFSLAIMDDFDFLEVFFL